MSLVVDNKMETIKIPSSYKNIIIKMVNTFSADEVEKRIFLNEEDYLFFSEKQEKELVWLDSYKNLKNTINNKFWWK